MEVLKNPDFFNKYSDEDLKKLLAVEIVSVTDKSPTVKNLFEELKRRNHNIKIDDYNYTLGLIDYLLTDTVDEFAQYCLNKLSFSEELEEEYNYSYLPLCVIDAVFSIGVRYEGAKNVVKNVCSILKIPKVLFDRNNQSKINEQMSVSNFLKKIEGSNGKELANSLFKNHQRTSSKNGILKSEAVILFLKILQKFNVEYFWDINKIVNNEAFEKEIKKIKGQSSGISLKYFYMLAGNDGLIKPDRWILKFLYDATGKKLNHDEAQETLVITAGKISEILNRKISPFFLDNVIWKYQRVKSKRRNNKCQKFIKSA